MLDELFESVLEIVFMSVVTVCWAVHSNCKLADVCDSECIFHLLDCTEAEAACQTSCDRDMTQ